MGRNVRKKWVRYQICVVMAVIVAMSFVSGKIFRDLEAKENRVKDIICDTRMSDDNVGISGQDLKVSAVRDWKTQLVNRWNPMEKAYSGTLIPLAGGQAIDERCYPNLQQMMDDCRAAGYRPVITSSYRTQKKQEELYGKQVQMLMGQGLSEREAVEKAGRVVAVPGTSEHQIGLAVDVVSEGNLNLDESQEKTGTQRWLMENSWKYGFILRYPSEKSDITGIVYEPWHYRYVGEKAAKEIYERKICLEEYLDDLSKTY